MMFKSLAAFAFASVAVTGQASAWVDEYNAKLNTPASQAALVKAHCNSTSIVDLNNCASYKKYGAPVSDVRYGIAATSLLVGGIVGGVLHVNPAIVGQKHLHILGWHPTFWQAVGVGAATGYVVTRVAYHGHRHHHHHHPVKVAVKHKKH